jgi:hypothetical protein
MQRTKRRLDGASPLISVLCRPWDMGTPPEPRGSDTDHSPGKVPSLATDTMADKAVRFGCGALMAGIAVAFLLSSVMAGGTGLILLATSIVLACGVLAVAYGESFIEGLLKVIEKLWPTLQLHVSGGITTGCSWLAAAVSALRALLH